MNLDLSLIPYINKRKKEILKKKKLTEKNIWGLQLGKAFLKSSYV